MCSGPSSPRRFLSSNQAPPGRTDRVRIRLASRLGGFADNRACPGFEEVEQEVKNAWVAEQRTEARRKAFETMKTRY